MTVLGWGQKGYFAALGFHNKYNYFEIDLMNDFI